VKTQAKKETRRFCTDDEVCSPLVFKCACNITIKVAVGTKVASQRAWFIFLICYTIKKSSSFKLKLASVRNGAQSLWRIGEALRCSKNSPTFWIQKHKMDFKTAATNHAVLTLKRHLPGNLQVLIITPKAYVFKNTPLVLNSCREWRHNVLNRTEMKDEIFTGYTFLLSLKQWLL